MTTTLKDIPDSTCSCERCQRMCEERPCWSTPKEASALIKAGYGDRLWLDFWAGGFGDDYLDDVNILAPAAVGSEKAYRPFWPTGRCTFLTDEGLCELHDLGLKPTEGRKASCAESHDKAMVLHEAVARTWDDEAAQHLVGEWTGDN